MITFCKHLFKNLVESVIEMLPKPNQEQWDKLTARARDNGMMERYFKARTKHHIALVKKYLSMIMDLKDYRLFRDILEDELDHDGSKFHEPEFTPYLYINWKYMSKDQGLAFNPPKEIQDQMRMGTYHHVKHNKHHPEFWDINATLDSINPDNRDLPPEKMVDASKMPLSCVAAMVADWMAMAEEKKSNPIEWADNNVNKRWKFTNIQVKLIYDLLNRVWRSDNA